MQAADLTDLPIVSLLLLIAVFAWANKDWRIGVVMSLTFFVGMWAASP